MCTYSLVPITLTPVRLEQGRYSKLSLAFAVSKEDSHLLPENSFDTCMIYAITTHQSSPPRSSQTPQSQLINLYYFFQFVKELNSLLIA